jgi:uncharacterized protein YbjT (DUF2867 family)
MARVLVTGGNGVLGRNVVERLVGRGHAARAASRSAPERPVEGATWTRLDLATGEGLAAALDGVDVVVHAASSPFRDTHAVDVDGTARLVEAAGRRHVVYVSIVGCDLVPLPYYRTKTEAEAVVAGGGAPWSVLRATQFHELLADVFLPRLDRFPAMPVPSGMRYQPIAAGEVADRLVEVVEDGPGGRLPDVGGPEVHTFVDLARRWIAAQGRRRPVVPIPAFGAVAAAIRSGALTCPDAVPDGRRGRLTWDDWLRRRYAAR